MYSNMLIVECCVISGMTATFVEVTSALDAFFRDTFSILVLNTAVSEATYASNALLCKSILHLKVCEATGISPTEDTVAIADADLDISVYELYSDQPVDGDEVMDEAFEEGENASAAVAMMHHTALPTAQLDGTWDSLVFDSEIKVHLIHYVQTAMLFSDLNVDPNVISFNRVVLLWGPPGTGKTTLCRAMAQKLSIRMKDRFPFARLMEINSHSLFSKWFSESGKLVARAFKQIKEMAEDPECFVCVLIDEVESLTAARTASFSGSEPSDAIRVVNAVLTQVDRLKHYPNVLVLTTSNVSQAIDVKQYIGPPSHAAIYTIFSSCIAELIRKGVIRIENEEVIVDWHRWVVQQGNNNVNGVDPNGCAVYNASPSERLSAISLRCVGMSGRTLRRLPFLAHAKYIQVLGASLTRFLDALDMAITFEVEQGDQLKSGCS